MMVSPRLERALLAALLAATALLFSPTLHAPFLYDDRILILDQSQLHGLSRWTEWFTLPYWPEAFHQGLYRPLISASYALTWALAGAASPVFHLTNILLHVLVTGLVWWTARRIGLSPIAALMATLLFAVHPVHVEVVAGIVYRTDSLSAAAMLAALGAFLGRSGHALRWSQVCVVALCLALAMGFKESGLLLPALLVGAEVILRPGRRTPARHAALALISVAIIALCIAAKIAVCGSLGVEPAYGIYPNSTLWERFAAMPRVLAEYLRLLVWPMSLAADHWWPLPEPSASGSLLGLATLVAVAGAGLAAVLALRRRWPRIAFALLWIGIGLTPYLHLVPIGAVVAERFAYVASVGLCWLVGALCDASSPRWKIPFLVAVLVISALFAGRSFRQARLWCDPLELWATSAEESPLSHRAWLGLGEARLESNDLEGAAAALRRAVELDPTSAFARMSLARAERQLGHLEAAERVLREALAINPSQTGVIGMLAQVLLDERRPADARDLLEGRGLAAQPQSPRMWFNIAVVRAAQGDRRGAAAALASAEALGYPRRERLEAMRRSLDLRGE
jgi:Tfp pilus assembly protein PilF